MVGPLLRRILGDQFRRLRDGDRFYYRHQMSRDMIKMIDQQTLATIIRRNTGLGNELQDNVFILPGSEPVIIERFPRRPLN